MTESQSAEPLRIVLVHRYFYPDTPPYASILKAIAEELGKAGHVVSVLTCQPSYNPLAAAWAPRREQLAANVDVTRWTVVNDRASLFAKVWNLVTFTARLMFSILRMPRVDVVMAASTPPVGVALAASLAARAKGASFVYHKQDIYPEVTGSTSTILTPMYKALRRIDSTTDARAAKVVVLSSDMARTIERRHIESSKIAVLNNFDPWDLQTSDEGLQSPTPSDIVRIVYAGNLGRFQNLEAVFACLLQFKGDERVRFDFVGEGPLRSRLEALVEAESLLNVRVHGYVAPRLLATLLRSACDVGIVSLNPGVIRAAFPSKTMSYLRNGVPLLAMVEADSQFAHMLEDYAVGWTADPTVPGSLERAIHRVIDERGRLPQMRDEARLMYESQFGADAMLQRWTALFDEVGRAR